MRIVISSPACDLVTTTTNRLQKMTTVFQTQQLPFESVTVFSDRAEVKRTLNTYLTAGIHEIVIEDVAESIDSNSIHIEGTGNAQIHEVNYRNDVDVSKMFLSEEILELLEDGKERQARIDELQENKLPYTRMMNNLDTMLSKMFIGESGRNNPALTLNQQAIDGVTNLFTFYEERTLDLMKKIRTIDAEMKENEERRNEIEREILMKQSQQETVRVMRRILFTVEALEEGDVEFTLTYRVSRATWTSTYDIRLVEAKNESEKRVLKIDSFALIGQDTGEEWTDAKILLSTAQPGIKGNVPELPTLHASIVQPLRSLHSVNAFTEHRKPSGGGLFGIRPAPVTSMGLGLFGGTQKAAHGGFGASQSAAEQAQPASGLFGNSQQQVEEPPVVQQEPPSPPPIAHVAMHAVQQVLSTEFEIPHKKTIPSDDSAHKMLISTSEFEPSLLHECVPSIDCFVYLTATVVNTSDIPFLAGSASVYFNHSFVANTNLKYVAPGEKFTCALGVDTAVKVTYKPAQKSVSESGVFNLNKQRCVTHKQEIVVQNTKPAQEVNLLIREQIPKAKDDKIKVNVIQPRIDSIKEESQENAIPAPGCVVNSDHNLEWTVKLAANEKNDLEVEWTMEYPHDQVIEYKMKDHSFGVGNK